jgi:hypothetical protein
MRSAQGYRRPRELTGPPLSKSKKKIHSKMRCIEILKRVYRFKKIEPGEWSGSQTGTAVSTLGVMGVLPPPQSPL